MERGRTAVGLWWGGFRHRRAVPRPVLSDSGTVSVTHSGLSAPPAPDFGQALEGLERWGPGGSRVGPGRPDANLGDP